MEHSPAQQLRVLKQCLESLADLHDTDSRDNKSPSPSADLTCPGLVIVCETDLGHLQAKSNKETCIMARCETTESFHLLQTTFVSHPKEQALAILVLWDAQLSSNHLTPNSEFI